MLADGTILVKVRYEFIDLVSGKGGSRDEPDVGYGANGIPRASPLIGATPFAALPLGQTPAVFGGDTTHTYFWHGEALDVEDERGLTAPATVRRPRYTQESIAAPDGSIWTSEWTESGDIVVEHVTTSADTAVDVGQSISGVPTIAPACDGSTWIDRRTRERW